MPYCCVITCKNHSGKTNMANSGVSYHRFPSDPATRQKWIEVSGRKDTNWLPPKTGTICSKHFNNDIIYLSGNHRRVPDDAVPTLLLPGSENGSESNKSESDEDRPLVKIGRDNSNKKTLASLDRANKMIKKQTLFIKKLREQNRRASKKIDLQNKIINDLMEIYGLKNEDIAVLKAEILRTDAKESDQT